MPKLDNMPVHLGRGATAVVEPAFDGEQWFAEYAARHHADGAEGRLIMQHDFIDSWEYWEVHPFGDEVVICTDGALTLLQEHSDGIVERLPLGAGDYAINPAGVWHTADVDVDVGASCIFVTSGQGTRHRSR